jgi:hypothetical protein
MWVDVEYKEKTSESEVGNLSTGHNINTRKEIKQNLNNRSGNMVTLSQGSWAL